MARIWSWPELGYFTVQYSIAVKFTTHEWHDGVPMGITGVGLGSMVLQDCSWTRLR